MQTEVRDKPLEWEGLEEEEEEEEEADEQARETEDSEDIRSGTAANMPEKWVGDSYGVGCSTANKKLKLGTLCL